MNRTSRERPTLESRETRTGESDDATETTVPVEGESQRQSRQVGTGLVFTREYYPGTTFRVLGRLPASLTVAILDGPPGRDVAVISQPDDYAGYVIRYEIGRASAYAFLFSRELLRSAVRYRIGPETTYFSPVLNLVEARLDRVGDGNRRRVTSDG